MRCGGACAPTGMSSAARRCATGSSTSWWRSSASRAGRRPRSADAIYDELTARLAEPAFRPRALFERFRIAVLATTDDPCDDLAAHAALAADPTLVRPRDPDLPARPLPRAGRPGWPELMARLAEVSGVETGDYPGSWPRMEARRRHFIAHGATSADHSHEDVRTDAARARRGRPHLPRRRSPARRPPAEAVALRRHMLLEMARMSCEDGLVMTLHPGVRRGHHGPTTRALRGRRRARHPDPGRVHRRAAPAARALRHAPRVPPRAVHARRDRVLARARAAGRLLPVGVRRARRGGSSTPPRRSGATAARSPRPPASPAPRASSTTPARSARSPPATTCPAAWTRLPRRAGRRAPARRGRGGRGGGRPGHRPPDGGVQAVSDRVRAPSAAGRRRCGWCTSASATSSAPTRPGTPTAPERRAGGSPPSPAAAPRSADGAQRPGRALHAGHARRRRRPLRRDLEPRARLPRRRHDAWLALLGRRPRCAW